jgi:DNA helicase-2/ATP-dependent DNA helicase PcrA
VSSEPSDAAAPAVLLRDTDHLCEVLGVPFSDEQLDIVTAPLRPGVVVAGAGSGKTTVMTARVVWLVGTGQVLPSEVLGLTFTNKAAGELGARVRSALQRLAAATGTTRLTEELGEPTVSTYHAYAGALLSEHGLRLGLEPDLRVVSDATRFQLAARVVTGSQTPVEHLSGHLPTVIESVLALDSQMQDHLLTLADLRAHDERTREQLAQAPPGRGGKPLKPVLEAVTTTCQRDELLELVAAYRELKAAEGIAEFSDQMAAGARLAIECPEVGEAERARFRAVLLDEYQDTSVSQRLMLQGLFSGGPGHAGRGHAVTAVGDPCQGIYGWRGASVDNIDDFGIHFPLADGRPADTFSLLVNRRCAARILDAANDLAAPLYDVHKGAQPLAPKPDAPAGWINLALHETVVDEIAWVPGEVTRMRADLGRDGAPARWSDIAVLVRNRQELAELAGALRRAGVPAEVVGLSGLLSQPEVADVVATLRVVSDLTANAALLRLLTGPRWRIGVRDLALLGQRSAELVRGSRGGDGDDLDAALDAAVAGIDPAEVASLSDALADPGHLDYSPQARARFAALAAELSTLRRAAGEPLTELVRRIVLTLGLDVELAAAPGPDAQLAGDNLALLLETVAEFAARDPFASVHGLVAYLDAEIAFNQGMGVAEPTESDSVKLLTAHSAKGLEWRGVLLPFMSEGVFPSTKGRARWEWSARDVPWPLRGDSDNLPALREWTSAAIDHYSAACRAHAELEERRLAYVAVTRAKELLVASGHWWGRTQVKPRGPSSYLSELLEHVDRQTEAHPWHADEPEDGARNPVVDAVVPARFPASLDDERLRRRRRAAAAVAEALEQQGAESPEQPGDESPERRGDEPPEVAAAVLAETGIDLAALDTEIEQLVAEARSAATGVVEVDLPPTLSATAVARLRDDPDGFARDLARPLPRRPSAAARFGTRFHTWVESHVGQQSFLDPTDLPGRADAGIADEAELAALKEAFAAGPFGHRVPHAVEAPFTLLLAGQSVVGRIDAVYTTDDGFEVVDWKTGHREDADPLQLALYRLAWAEAHDLPLDRVGAAFYHVRSGRVVRPRDLPDRAGIEALLSGRER